MMDAASAATRAWLCRTVICVAAQSRIIGEPRVGVCRHRIVSLTGERRA